MEWSLLAILPGLIIWIIILLLPWRPWSTRETLDPQPDQTADLTAVTVLVPARNEAVTITATLTALKQQAPALKVILIDDESTDDTATLARASGLEQLTIITGTPLPKGWSGKLWALEQGRQQVQTPYLLLLDADIVLKPALVATALTMMQQQNLKMLSLMANLKMVSLWERLFLPAFIFFFKLLYPFQLANKPNTMIAAAAGGFILLDTAVLTQLGGFDCIKNALIDDCALAKAVKKQGYKTWLGLTHSALSIRSYDNLATILAMVTRTAYTQLTYSPLLLLVCTLLMVAAFAMPLLVLCASNQILCLLGLLTLLLQTICYLSTLRYYSIPFFYALSLPFVGILYLLMTWHSAIQYYFGNGANWKGRHYH